MHRPNPDRVGIQDCDFSLSFLDAFDRHFAARLNHRAATFRALFERALAFGRPLTVVETGCLRDPGNWAGDGQSTFLFDCLVAETGGAAWSVDIVPASVSAAREATSANVNLALNDSVAFLACFERPIDVLYLDSFDLDANQPLHSATHHLYEFAAAQRWLRPGSLILVDDTYLAQGQIVGKGMLIAEYMRRIGANVIAEGYQSLWAI